MRIVPANRSFIGASVAGTVDADYLAAWLTDGLPGKPVYRTGNLTLTATVTSPVTGLDVIAVCHHAIRDGATIDVAGDAAAIIPTAPYLADDIPTNWFALLEAPVDTDTIILTVTDNDGDPVIIGEMYAGASHLFDNDLLIDREFDPGEPFPWEGEFSSLAPYDAGIADQRRTRGETIMTDADYAILQSAYLSQRRGSRPVLFIPSDLVNDAWLCQFKYTERFDTVWHYITIEITEIPRVRW